MPCSWQSRGLSFRINSIFPPVWEQTKKVVTDTLIRPLVALLHQFAKEAGDIVAARLPALEQIWQVRINVRSLLTWFAFRKGSGREPMTDGAVTNAHLLGNGLLTQPLLT